MLRNQILKVIPNPWFSLDDQGNPSGVVPVDPSVNRNRAFVGAEIVDVQVLDEYQKGYMLSARQYHNWKFSNEPITLPVTHYYKDAVKSGTLLAADEQTAKTCQVTFADTRVILESERKKAALNWKAAYGEFPEWYRDEDKPPPSNVVALKKSAAE